MTCFSTSQWAQIIEGDITPQVKRDAQKHLESCANCRHKVELLQKTWAWLAEQSTPLPSFAFETQVLKRLHSQTPPAARAPKTHSRYLLFRKALPIAAAACVLIAMTIAMLDGGSKHNDTTQPSGTGNTRLAAPKEVYALTEDLAVLGAYTTLETEENLPLELEQYDIGQYITELEEAQDALAILEQIKLLQELSN